MDLASVQSFQTSLVVYGPVSLLWTPSRFCLDFTMRSILIRETLFINGARLRAVLQTSMKFFEFLLHAENSFRFFFELFRLLFEAKSSFKMTSYSSLLRYHSLSLNHEALRPALTWLWLMVISHSTPQVTIGLCLMDGCLLVDFINMRVLVLYQSRLLEFC